MIRHFAADGTVKREWPDGLHASAFEQDGKRFASVAKSNAVETVELGDGEQVGEAFEVHESPLAPIAADVHPIESALSATPASADAQKVKAVMEWIRNPLPPVAIAPEPEPTDIVMGTGPDATPVIETESGDLVPAPASVVTTATFNALTPPLVIPIQAAIPGSTTEHHAPLPSEVVETAAHALSDAAAVLKQEEARNASNAGALNVEPQGAQATHSTEAAQIPTVEAQHG